MNPGSFIPTGQELADLLIKKEADEKLEIKETHVKEMREKLCKQLSDYPSGVDQFVDLCRIADGIGFKVTKLFRGKDHVLDHVSGRYEIWIEIPGWSSSKAGKGNSLGDAVKDAIGHCFLMNRISKEEI
ncbi:MAG: hypothetical protein WCT42_01145 [Candidatus Paceibacterota bacterium]